MNTLVFSLFFILTGFCMSQKTHSFSKLAGTWTYTGGTGFERWTQHGEALHGEAYRYSSLGDTLLTERMLLKIKEGKLVLAITPQTFEHESSPMIFQLEKKRLFLNLTEASPYAIEYRFGFLSKRKLRYRVYYGMKTKPHNFLLKKE